MASLTSSLSDGSLSDASQLSATGATAPPPTHCEGGATFGMAWLTVSSRGGRLLSAQPASASAATTTNLGWARIGSVQLEYQIIHVRTDAKDDLADDVQELRVLRVDRSVARRAGGEEQFHVLVGDVELDSEALWRSCHHAGHRYRTPSLQLTRPLGPDDRVHLRLDDPPGIRVERKFRFVAGRDPPQLVLAV